MKSAHKGFTLIELLVVIAIIAVLSTIGFAVFSGVQKGARDAKRISDIDAISNAMEVQFGQCQSGKYCNITGTSFSSGSIPTDPLETSYGGTQNKCGTDSGTGATPCQYCFLAHGIEAYNNVPPWNAAHGGCSSIQPNPPTFDGGYWYNEPEDNSPGGSGNYLLRFDICANLENPIKGKNYYCKSNQL